MKKLTVYVVGFEADPTNSGVSGFNWYPNEEDADKDFAETFRICKPYKTEVYQGTSEIEVSSDYSGTDEEREEVTLKIEAFLEENNWENSFV